MTKYINLLIFSLLLILSNTINSQSIEYNPSIDVIDYDFAIKISDTTDVIKATSSNHFILHDNTDKIQFDLTSKDTTGKGMVIEKIIFEDIPLKFTHKNDKITIKKLDTWKSNDSIKILIFYSGIPKDGLIISNNKYGERSFFGDNWPDRAHNYLPVVDHPSDKSFVSFRITAPHHYEVVSNGMMIERSYQDTTNSVTHWESTTTIPTKVMVFAAANFSSSHLGKVGCIPVTAWVFNQNKEAGFSDYYPAVDVLTYFTNKLGDYPYCKLANVQSKTRYGGMENASCIFYYENSVTGKHEVDDLIAHEIAHQWYGNSVSEQDWPHIWLSEGFATYMADLYMQHRFGNKVFEDRLEGEKQKAISFIDRYPSPIIARDIKNLNRLLSPNSYQRAAWVLHMYHNKVGDDIFWETLSNYYHTYKDGNATTKNFISIANKTSGKNYTGFFDQWLDRPDYPILNISTSMHKKNLIVHIEQKQSGLPYNIDIPITITQNGEQETIFINSNKKMIDYTIKRFKKKDKVDFSGLNDIFCIWKSSNKL